MPIKATPSQRQWARKWWKQGLPTKTIATKLNIPRSTIRDWIKAWENPPPPKKKPGPKPKTPPAPKAPKGELATVQTEEIASPPPPPAAPRPPLNLLQPRPDGEPPSFILAEDELRRIIADKTIAPGVKVQAANALLKVVVLRAELPQDAILETTQASLGDSVAQVEGMDDGAIAQSYRELLGR